MSREVYARFWKEGSAWRVVLSDMRGEAQLRPLNFAHSKKIEDLAQRGGALGDLAAKQALAVGIRAGAGGFKMQLTEEQFRKVAAQSPAVYRKAT